MSEFPSNAYDNDPGLQPGAVPWEARQAVELLNRVEHGDVAMHDLSKEPTRSITAPISEITPIATSADGTEVMLASIVAGKGSEWQLWGQRNPDGSVSKDAIYLTNRTYDPSGNLPYIQHRLPIMAGQPLQVIGRESQDTTGRGLEMSPSVSRKHLGVAVNDSGEVVLADMGSTNGTTVLVRKNQASPELMPPVTFDDAEDDDTLVPERGPGPHRADMYKPVHEDPTYAALTAPYNERLHALWNEYKPARDQLQAAIERARSGLQDTESENLYDKLAALDKQYHETSAAVRSQLETAVKPYLAQRLEYFRNDRLPGFANSLYYDTQSRNVYSGDALVGKMHVMSHNDPGRVWTNQKVRLGQLSLPVRFSSWAGGSGGKTNHKTAVNTTSTQHIIDLAAAMEAGNFTSAHEPIVLERDDNASYLLQDDRLHGKMPMYKVQMGNHRIAAYRLLYGINAPAPYDEIKE